MTARTQCAERGRQRGELRTPRPACVTGTASEGRVRGHGMRVGARRA